VRYVPTFEEESAELRGVTVAKIKSFYKKFYGASHAELAIVGDFDPAQMTKEVEKLFGDWKSAQKYERVANPYREIKHAKMVFKTPDKANAFLMGALPMKVNDRNPDFPALMVANQVIGGNTDARLQTLIRSTEGLSYSVGSALQPSSIDENSKFIVYAIFAPQNRDRVEQGISKVLKESVTKLATPQEVASAKQSLLEARKIARAQDGTQTSNLVSQLFLGRDWSESAQRDAAIEAVTPEDVLRVLKKYLAPNAIVYSVAGDFKK
jgi:zinc protease